MHNPLKLITDLLRQPAWVPVWVGLLMMLNLASIAFWHEPLARWILAVFMVSLALMMGLYARFGFQKILGMGHVLWLVLLPVVLLEIPAAEGRFRVFLIVWVAATSVSLALDIFDVWTWFARKRARRPRPQPAGGSAGQPPAGPSSSIPGGSDPRALKPSASRQDSSPGRLSSQ